MLYYFTIDVTTVLMDLNIEWALRAEPVVHADTSLVRTQCIVTH